MSNAGNGQSPRETLGVYVDALLARAAPYHHHAQRMAYAALAFETAVFAIVMFAAAAQRFAPPLLILAAGAAAVLVGHVALATQLKRARAAAFLEAFAFALIRELILPEPHRGPPTPAAPPRRSGPLAAMADALASLLWGRLSQSQAQADPLIPPSLRSLAPLARVRDPEGAHNGAIALASLTMAAILAARIALTGEDPWTPQPREETPPAVRTAPLALNVQTPTPPAASPAPPSPTRVVRPRRSSHRPAPEPQQIEAPPLEPARSYWSGGPGTWRSYTSEGLVSDEDWADGAPG